MAGYDLGNVQRKMKAVGPKLKPQCPKFSKIEREGGCGRRQPSALTKKCNDRKQFLFDPSLDAGQNLAAFTSNPTYQIDDSKTGAVDLIEDYDLPPLLPVITKLAKRRGLHKIVQNTSSAHKAANAFKAPPKIPKEAL